MPKFSLILSANVGIIYKSKPYIKIQDQKPWLWVLSGTGTDFGDEKTTFWQRVFDCFAVEAVWFIGWAGCWAYPPKVHKKSYYISKQIIRSGVKPHP